MTIGQLHSADAMVPATKIIYLARRNPALSREAFPERWRQHSLLAGSMASIRPGFVQVAQCINTYDRTAVPRASLDYDGVNLLTLAEPAFAAGMWQSDEVHDLVLPDELQTFSGYVRHFSLTAREHVVVPGVPTAHCLIVFVKRDRRLDPDMFTARLKESHAMIADGRRRAVVNIVTDRQPGYSFDAVTELWFRSADEARAVLDAPRYATDYLTCRDRLCDEGRSVTMWTSIGYARPPLT